MPITCFTSAEANRALIRIVQDDVDCWARTPTTVGTKVRQLRFNSSDLSYNKETQASEEIRADRMIANIIEVGASTEGSIDTEFSAFSHDMFLESVLGGTWSQNIQGDSFKGAGVSWTSTSTLVVAGIDVTPYWSAGQIIQTEGFRNAANNNIWAISTIVFAAGSTTITTTQVTAVIEAGNDGGRVFDAGDTLIYRNTGIRAGTAGASAFDSNGANAFTTLVAANKLRVGQRIFVAGLGYETGVITFTGGNPVDGDTITISDGDKVIVFEFDSNAAFTRGRDRVLIGSTDDDTATTLTQLINLAYAAGRLACGAKVNTSGAGGTITVTNYRQEQAGSLTENSSNITVTAFAGGNPATHGFYTITSVSNDVIGVAPAPGTNANAGLLAVTIKGSHLRNPGNPSEIVKRSFTVETHFTDVGQAFVTTGQRVGGMSFSASSGEIVTATYNFMGRGLATRQTSLLAAAPYVDRASTSTEPMNATVNVGQVRKNGQELNVAFESVEFEIDGNMRMQTAVGSKFPVGIAAGSLSVSGSVSAYFADLQIMEDMLNHNTISLSFDFLDLNRNAYTLTFPAVKITTDVVVPEGVNTDIKDDFEFQCQRDPVLQTMCMIDRYTSTYPPIA